MLPSQTTQQNICMRHDVCGKKLVIAGLSSHVADWKPRGWNATPKSCARLGKNGASKELRFSKNPSSLAWSDGLQGRYKTLQRLSAGCDCHHLAPPGAPSHLRVPQTRRQPLAYQVGGVTVIEIGIHRSLNASNQSLKRYDLSERHRVN